ncbi:MAG: hypothetical protein Q7U20_08400 [Caulobacter sp.]|nr:hypothetical protein [Caulobacter sp.]
MTSPKRSYTRVNRPAQAGELVGVRLQPEHLARIDAWRATQPAPLTRPEAMRLLMDLGLAARDHAPSLLDLSDLIFIDGLDRPAPRQDLAEASDMPLPPPEEPWPEDLRDSFIMAAEPSPISRSHESGPAPKPLPGKPLDRLGPLGPLAPLATSGRGRNR